MSGPLEIRLRGGRGEGVHLYLADHRGEDQLAAVIHAPQVETERDWLAELSSARAAKTGLGFLRGALADMDAAAAKPEGKGESEKARREAWAAGLEAGLRRESRPHPSLAGHVMAPEWERAGAWAFQRGWELGMAIQRATDLALVGESGAATDQVDEVLCYACAERAGAPPSACNHCGVEFPS